MYQPTSPGGGELHHEAEAQAAELAELYSGASYHVQQAEPAAQQRPGIVPLRSTRSSTKPGATARGTAAAAAPAAAVQEQEDLRELYGDANYAQTTPAADMVQYPAPIRTNSSKARHQPKQRQSLARSEKRNFIASQQHE